MDLKSMIRKYTGPEFAEFRRAAERYVYAIFRDEDMRAEAIAAFEKAVAEHPEAAARIELEDYVKGYRHSNYNGARAAGQAILEADEWDQEAALDTIRRFQKIGAAISAENDRLHAAWYAKQAERRRAEDLAEARRHEKNL